MSTCPVCGGQLPPYDYSRYLVFCGMKNHWPAGIELTPSESSGSLQAEAIHQGAMSNTVSIPYSIVSSGDESFVTAFVPGHPTPLVAAKSGHPNFETIVQALQVGEDDGQALVALFDVTVAVAAKFENLSDRVQVGNGRVLFDGADVDNALTKQIVRFMDEGVSDFRPLVNFMEKVMDNPEPHSRDQLYTWLDQRDFTITASGDIVAYKGVKSDGNGGYQSINSGSETVYVDGAPHKGHIPNPVGATVNMDRSLVHHDPAVGCHRGLHVGTFEYASSWSHGTVLEVHVNPRDVVSVPTDCSFQKVRCCRYQIVDVIDAKYGVAVLGVEDDADDWDDEYDADDWDDEYDDGYDWDDWDF